MRWTVPLASLALLTLASAQSPIFRLGGTRTNEAFGRALEVAGDVNGDGYADIVIGAPGDDTRGQGAGAVHVVSGHDGGTLWHFAGERTWQALGNSVAAAGDVDNDGVPDIIAGGNDQVGSSAPGIVRVYSGKSGRVLYTWRGRGAQEQLGLDVAAAGDVNGDGHADVAVSAWNDKIGFVRIYSGKNGGALWTVPGREPYFLFGGEIAGLGDVNADGVPDLAVTSLFLNQWTDVVWILSGKNGNTLLGIFSPRSKLDVGSNNLASAGDVDGDGANDILVAGRDRNFSPDRYVALVLSSRTGRLLRVLWAAGGPKHALPAGAVGDLNGDRVPDFVVGNFVDLNSATGDMTAISGADGAVLFRIRGETTKGFGLPWSFHGLGDVNGDGKPDFVAGGLSAHQAPAWSGAAWVFSGRPLSLTSNTHLVSVTRGRQELALDAGVGESDQLYVLLGSASGVRPGTGLGSVHLALNLDGYTLFTLGHPNSAVLVNSLGRLDSRGRARAAFQLPSGLGSVIGLRLHHAFVTLSPGGRVRTASNPASLLFVR